MSHLKFDFSDVTVIKMREEKKKKLKKFKKPKFVKPETPDVPEVVTLSDSEELKDPVEIIEKPIDIIDLSESTTSECEPKDPSIEVVELDDKELFCNNQCKFGKVCSSTRTLDYIPIGQWLSCAQTKAKRKKKQKALLSADIQPPVKRKKTDNLSNGSKKKSALKPIVIDGSNAAHKKTEHNNPKETPLLKLTHSNIYDGSGQKVSGLRPIVIDGSNVACQYGNGLFDFRGVILVIQYFLNRGHTDITCFLPAHFRNRCTTEQDKQIIRAYEKDKIITYTPSRKLIDGQSIVPYDDRFIIQYANASGGVIITNDGYRDLINEEPSWKNVIEKRLINYTFAKDIFMLPKDPLGRYGPSLDDMLKFS